MAEVSNLNGYKIKDKKATRFYNNVESMINDTTLKEGMHVQTQGFYESNDKGGAFYLISSDDLTSNDIDVFSLNNGLYAILIEDDEIDLLKLGVKIGKTEDPQTELVQYAIDKAGSNNKNLKFPNGYIHIDDTIYIKDPITIIGNSNSTYSESTSVLYYDGDEDINLLHIEKSNGNKLAGVKIYGLGCLRKRNSEDGFVDIETTPWVYGTKCTGVYAHVDESTFYDMLILGCENGFKFYDSSIFQVENCDIICNENGFNFDTNGASVAINNNNCWQNYITFYFNCRGYQYSFFQNHCESAKHHFYVNVQDGGNKGALERISVLHCNFTSLEDRTESLLYINSEGTTYKIIRDFQFSNCRVIMNQGNPIKINYTNTQLEMYLSFIDTNIWCDNAICIGHNTYNPKIAIKNLQYYKYNGNKWSDTSYLIDNCVGIENKGFKNYAFGDLNFIKKTSLPSPDEGLIYYNANNNGKRLEYFNDDNYRKIITPTIINPNSSGSAPGYTPTSLTVAINQLLYGGDSLGWVFHPTTNAWVRLPQIGQRQISGSPSGTYTPKFIGEMLLDTTNSDWYIATGTTNSDWKKIT